MPGILAGEQVNLGDGCDSRNDQLENDDGDGDQVVNRQGGRKYLEGSRAKEKD